MTMAIATTITTTIPMLMTTNRAAFDGHSGVDGAEAAALYRLLTWLSPSFPVGAFSYSSGIEWAVEAGDIVDAPSLQDWLACMLTDGPGFCDGVLLAHTHRAASSSSHAGLREIAELAAAFVPSRERQLETSAQGRAFVDIARAAWNCEGLDQMVSSCDGAIVYPVAVGLVSAAHDIRLAPAMQARVTRKTFPPSDGTKSGDRNCYALTPRTWRMSVPCSPLLPTAVAYRGSLLHYVGWSAFILHPFVAGLANGTCLIHLFAHP